MMGLFAAVIFSAVLSTISSTLNSLAAVTWEDFLSKIPFFEKMGDFAQATTYKTLTIFYGTICVLLSFLAENFGGIFQSAITVIGTAVGVQGSLFLMGVFFPFVNKHGAIWGMLVGLTCMSYLTFNAILIGKDYDINPKLPLSTDNCSDFADAFFNATTFKNATKLPASDLHYPEKLFSVSYQLYSTIGGSLTIIVAIFVSVLTGGCKNAKYVRPEYLHPMLRPKKMGFTPTLTKVEVNRAFEPDNEIPMQERKKF
jgi:sodium-coupled monocarboxylate transporter 8/12